MSCTDIEVDDVFLRTPEEERAVRGLLFENLKISGCRIGSADQANLDIGGNVFNVLSLIRAPVIPEYFFVKKGVAWRALIE